MSLLHTYLNDHLAGAVAAGELARRAAGSNRGTSYSKPLARLAGEIGEDRATLQDMMADLGIGADRLKTTAAWAAEKLGRLKLNGSLISYSPLSRVVELEVLILGVEGKLLLWQALAEVNLSAPGHDFDALIRRTRNQLRALRRLRLAAVAEALR